jgi:hypothetical protein
MSSRIVLFAVFISLGISFSASITAAQDVAATAPARVDNKFVQEQFGDTCSLEPNFTPMVADLNGDGIADIVIVARCKNPLIDQGEKNYKVVDPMTSFFGYGNPVITTSFAPDDPKMRGVALLVIHGAGADTWRSATPVSKFVIINLSIKTISLRKMKVRRKKSVNALYVEEATADQMTSAIFWDGKKYRYEPMGSSME